jgi:hypothetical protein
MSSADGPNTARTREDEMSENESVAAGWHADRTDPMITRYWNGRRWTSQRRWSGTDWVEVALAPPATSTTDTLRLPDAAPAVTAAPAGGGVAERVGAALTSTSTTFKVFVVAAFACVLGYFVPVTIITTDSGYSEARSLTDAGGFGVLILAAAGATIWLAWPIRHGGVVTQRALWGLGGMVTIIVLFTIGVLSALGTKEEDLVVMTSSQSVEPSLGLFLLVAAVVAQVVGILLAIRDRRRAGR